MFNKNEQGLTLIEMMLVVTVIAVATLSTMKILRTRTSSTQIDQIAIQMQNVGQGVINYYMLNHAWPTTSTTPSSLLTLTEGGANPVFFSPQTLCTPFSDTTQNSALCKGYALIQGQALNSTNYYQVVLKADSENTALAIANQLPDATVNGTVITMSILPPGASFLTNSREGWIVAAGVISFAGSPADPSGLSSNNTAVFAGPAVVLPNCPTGFEGHVIFVPFRYHASGGDAEPNWHITQTGVDSAYNVVPESPSSNLASIPGFNGGTSVYNASLPPQNVPQESSSTGIAMDVYAIHLADDFSPTDPYYNVGYYLTMCIPLGHWAASGISQNFLQDGQCAASSIVDTSWATFLKSGNPAVSPNMTTCTTLMGSNSIPSTPLGSPDAY